MPKHVPPVRLIERPLRYVLLASSRPRSPPSKSCLTAKSLPVYAFTCESAHHAFSSASQITRSQSLALAGAERRSSDGGRTGRRLRPTKRQNFGQARGPEVSGFY